VSIRALEVLKRARKLEKELAERGREVAILSSFNADFLRPWLLCASDDAGVLLAPWTGPFGQLEQQILDAASELWSRSPAAVVILARASDLDETLGPGVDGLEAAELRERVEQVVARLVSLACAARERFEGSILVGNLCLDDEVLDVFDANRPDGVAATVAAGNARLAEALSTVAGAVVFDHAGASRAAGAESFFDPRLFSMSRAGVANEAQDAYAQRLVKSTLATLQPAAKCLVLDLDNTLWGGVLGDDGIDGVKLGDEGEGYAFKCFQRALSGYRKRGMLLAVASKNDPELAREALASHPEMVLQPDDFASVQAGWGRKSEMCLTIADELNIGVDSLVFIDDNPVERAEVRAGAPGVFVVEMPTDPYAYARALRLVPHLDRPTLAAEDRSRADMVQADRQRRTRQSSAGSVADFLAGLGMKVLVEVEQDRNFTRVHQLINKTNQFNLTTRRHSEEELRRMMAADDTEIVTLRLEDRFGDLGLIAIGIVRVDGVTAEVDTLLMSCRVMNRGVEDALLHELGQRAAALGGKALVGAYLPTKRNTPVATFFPDRGFTDRGEGRYERAIDELPSWPEHIERVERPTEA
jgi:FkbH-like protein